MDRITSSPLGVLVYLPYQEGRGIGLVNKIRAYALQDQGYDTVDANVAIGAPIEARDYDLAAHILFDLGYPEIKLLTNNPAKVEALREEGVDVDRADAADRQALALQQALPGDQEGAHGAQAVGDPRQPTRSAQRQRLLAPLPFAVGPGMRCSLRTVPLRMPCAVRPVDVPRGASPCTNPSI